MTGKGSLRDAPPETLQATFQNHTSEPISQPLDSTHLLPLTVVALNEDLENQSRKQINGRWPLHTTCENQDLGYDSQLPYNEYRPAQTMSQTLPLEYSSFPRTSMRQPSPIAPQCQLLGHIYQLQTDMCGLPLRTSYNQPLDYHRQSSSCMYQSVEPASQNQLLNSQLQNNRNWLPQTTFQNPLRSRISQELSAPQNQQLKVHIQSYGDMYHPPQTSSVEYFHPSVDNNFQRSSGPVPDQHLGDHFESQINMFETSQNAFQNQQWRDQIELLINADQPMQSVSQNKPSKYPLQTQARYLSSQATLSEVSAPSFDPSSSSGKTYFREEFVSKYY